MKRESWETATTLASQIARRKKGSINTKTDPQKTGVGKGKLESIKLIGFKKEGNKK